MRGIIAVSLLTLLHGAGRAQTPASKPPVLPPGPLLNKPPDSAQWTVTIKATGAQPAAQAAPESGEASAASPKAAGTGDVRIGVIKTGKIAHSVRARGNEVMIDVWVIDGAAVNIDPITKVTQVAPGGSVVDAFPALEWISEKNFAAMEKIGGKDCLVFKAKVPPIMSLTGEPFGESVDQVSAVAYIDLETRFPVSMQRGPDLYTYQLGPVPQAPLIPPAEIQQSLGSYLRRVQRAKAGPARGTR